MHPGLFFRSKNPVMREPDDALPDLSHDNVDLDEEANLAYVAATRAKENLFISYPRHNSKSKDEIAPSRYFARFFAKK